MSRDRLDELFVLGAVAVFRVPHFLTLVICVAIWHLVSAAKCLLPLRYVLVSPLILIGKLVELSGWDPLALTKWEQQYDQ